MKPGATRAGTFLFASLFTADRPFAHMRKITGKPGPKRIFVAVLAPVFAVHSDFSILICVAQPAADYCLPGCRIVALNHFGAGLHFRHQFGIAHQVGDTIFG